MRRLVAAFFLLDADPKRRQVAALHKEMANLRIPVSTYRLQFNSKFRFEDARALVPYLAELGVTDLYASPLLQARHGSSHGYDVTDPSRLNAELGSEEEFEGLARELQQRGMGLILDIVPNHLAASSDNPWWMDVLENGRASPYAIYFDIDWHPPRRTLENKVLLPLLGTPYAQALENQELTLLLEPSGFFIKYSDSKLPVAPKSYPGILKRRLDQLRKAAGPEDAAFREFEGILAALAHLPEPTTAPFEGAAERRLQGEAVKERLWRLYSESAAVRGFLDENIRILNGKKGESASFLPLDRLLSEQAHVLSFWKSVNQEINYRRFFTITDLVGVRVEDPLVFETTHAVVMRLIEKGLVTGLRVDHVDGLRDPLAYLRRLQERVNPGAGERAPLAPFYVVVEKILSPGESLPAEWPVYGTSGYDFLNVLNGVAIDRSNSGTLDEVYSRFAGKQYSYADLVYEKKKQVIESLLAVEMHALGHHLSLLAEQDRYARDLPWDHLERALKETTACFPVYRTYTRGLEVKPEERRYVEQAIQAARRRNRSLPKSCFRFLRELLLLEQGPHMPAEQGEARLAFVMRWQQVTGSIMAKGFEDSLLYVYNRLLSLNEVGGAPQSSGVPVEALHQFLRGRQKHWPYAFSATSTHDTKRAEDARARINVLAEIPAEWGRRLRRWSRWNRKKRQAVDGHSAPTRNEEVLLYQTIVGAWPFRSEEMASFRERVQAYAVKATREAMVHTKWTLPNVSHERALTDFVAAIIEEGGDNRFLADFLPFQKRIAYYGALNGLAQLLIKIAAPGVPDFYQGSELWDLRLVDPDNRNPVDFRERCRMLDELVRHEASGLPALLEELLAHWEDGRIKLYVARRALSFRRAQAGLFLEGSYEPLTATGRNKENVIAFARRRKNAWALVAVPRLTTQLTKPGRPPLGRKAWGSTALALPADFPRRWLNVLTQETVSMERLRAPRTCYVRTLFRSFPVALLEGI